MQENTSKPNATDRIVFKPSLRKEIFIFLASIVFFLIGISFLRVDSVDSLPGWIALLFGGLGGIVTLLHLLRPGYLEITNRGFSINNLGRIESFAWSDIEAFGTFNGMVSFRINSPGVANMVTRQMGGYDGSIQNIYQVKVEDLLQILNEYKEKYGHN